MKKVFLLALTLLIYTGCKQSQEKNRAAEKARMEQELDFEVENKTGKTIYVTCFSYIQKEYTVRWRWDKSPVYKLDEGDSVVINVDTIEDDANREHTFGYLAVFSDEQKAHDSIYELTPDTKKIDLDQIFPQDRLVEEITQLLSVAAAGPAVAQELDRFGKAILLASMAFNEVPPIDLAQQLQAFELAHQGGPRRAGDFRGEDVLADDAPPRQELMGPAPDDLGL